MAFSQPGPIVVVEFDALDDEAKLDPAANDNEGSELASGMAAKTPITCRRLKIRSCRMVRSGESQVAPELIVFDGICYISDDCFCLVGQSIVSAS